MWPAGTLLFPLPDSFQASEDTDFFELRHRKCGQIVATFSATGAKPEEIVAAALAHQCPRPTPPVKLCVRCRKEIGEFKTRCPYCGADNPLLPE